MVFLSILYAFKFLFSVLALTFPYFCHAVILSILYVLFCRYSYCFCNALIFRFIKMVFFSILYAFKFLFSVLVLASPYFFHTVIVSILYVLFCRHLYCFCIILIFLFLKILFDTISCFFKFLYFIFCCSFLRFLFNRILLTSY